MFRDHDRIVPTLRTLLASLLLVAFVGAISGCNTTEGAGKDIENLGEGIQDAAD